MKKIYYVANIRLPTEKAHGIQIMQMCQAFADLGYEVELVVPDRKTVMDGVEVKEDPFEYYDVRPNFKITRLWCLDWVKWGKIGFILQSITFTEHAILRSMFKKGLFYTRDEMMAALLTILGKKVAWEVHMELRNIFTRILIQLNVPIIAITAGLKDLYKSMGVDERRILVAHDAVNLRLFNELPDKSILRKELGLLPDRFIIAYIGKYKTMGWTKGVEDVIKPFADINKRHPESFLLLVGPGNQEIEELKKILEDNSISKEDYKIQSHVPHKMTPRYMKASDLLLILYPNTPHYAKYMSPLKLFEYMASGTPILASDLPSIREVVEEEDCYFYEADNMASLTNAISYAISDIERSRYKAKSALQKVGQCSWKKRAEKIANFAFGYVVY